MKRKFETFVEIPEGIECKIEDGILECKKNEKQVSRKMEILRTNVSVKERNVNFSCAKANKNHIKIIKSNVAHVKNMFTGLENEFVYKLEICHVHFPMTVKAEGDKVVISNFLGEKTNRYSKIVPGANVEIKGKEITVSGLDVDQVGQTAANLEKATKIKKKDRRIFQDGIFIVEKKWRKE